MLTKVLHLELIVCLFSGVSVSAAEPPKRKYTNLQRLEPAHLKAVHEDVEKLKAKREKILTRAGLNDYRCILHAHAEDSTHTGGTLNEMLADAKKAGVNAILLSDHFRPPRDFIDGRWRGLKEGVLFIPGSEVRGFLVYPMKSILQRMELKTPEFIETVTDGDGMIFLSHIEERRAHPVDGLTGLEIYNRHWDAKQDKLSLLALGLALTDPKQAAELEKSVKQFPDEVFAFQSEYPKVYIEKWDEGTKKRRLTGVAANDCHHNTVLTVKMVDADTVLVGTNVDPDDKMQKISASLRPGIRELTKGRKPGDILVRIDTDPYAVSFRNSSTHVLAPKLDETAIRSALKAGHAYASHDWMCDPTGFSFDAMDQNGKELGVMGDEVKRVEGLRLFFWLPVPAHIRLLRNGEEVRKLNDQSSFTFRVEEPGAYRLEAWLELDGELRPWIYSNPIHIK